MTYEAEDPYLKMHRDRTETYGRDDPARPAKPRRLLPPRPRLRTVAPPPLRFSNPPTEVRRGRDPAMGPGLFHVRQGRFETSGQNVRAGRVSISHRIAATAKNAGKPQANQMRNSRK